MILSFLHEASAYFTNMSTLEALGLIFGLLCVYFLIKENILTWPCGIIYVLLSFVVFWQSQLYGDFLLHIIFLILNIYGWYTWVNSKGQNDEGLVVTKNSTKENILQLSITAIGILLFAQLLIHIPSWINGMAPAALPYWDSTTSVLSVTAIWLTTIKKIDNWYYWFVVDILAVGIYYHKELYFYSLLYFIYIFLAVAGYLAWRKSMTATQHI